MIPARKGGKVIEMIIYDRQTRQNKDVGTIWAVDYDGTLDFAGFPNVGKMNYEAIFTLQRLQKKGDKVILWTCRGGGYLRRALDELELCGFYPDAVNKNIQVVIDAGLTSPKVVADYYIDDRAIGLGNIKEVFEKMDRGEL